MGPELLQAVLTIGFGALAGGLTNAVAIWMLFHPHRAMGPRFLRIQGAIPKNHERLAKTIGRTVGQKLLTPGDLAAQLSSSGLRSSFDRAVTSLLQDLLTRDRGTLRQELPPGARAEVEVWVAKAGPALATALAGRTDIESGVREWLGRQRERLAENGDPVLDRLPPDLVAAVEKGVASYLPLALERVAVALRDPEARGRIEEALHSLYRRLLQDLMLHQRVVARLVLTEKTITKLLDTFGEEGADDLARLLDEPEMRAQVGRAVNEALERYLRRPLSSHLTALGPERVATFEETIARWLAAAIKHESTQHGIAETVAAILDRVLDAPIGRLADRLGADATDRLPAMIAPALWEWIQAQVPGVVEHLDIPTMVEQKVLGFSLDRMEEIVRTVTQRELDLIVRIGYVLGGLIGTVAWLSGRLVG